MKFRIFLVIFLLNTYSAISYANINAANGFYLGGDLTYMSYITMDEASFRTTFNALFGKFTLRPYIGYHINDYFSLESGYLDLINEHYNGGEDVQTPLFGQSISGPDHYRLYSIDFAGKAIYPFENGFSLYGKAGLAFVHQSVFNQMYMDSPPMVDSNVNKILPLIGCGISYNFTSRFASDLSFMHIQGRSPINNINSLGLGLSYTLG